MKKQLSICFVMFALLACKNKPAKHESIMIPTPNGVPSVSSLPASSATVNPDATRPTMNPAHGAPFHDCAIPVGAPLASKQSSVKPEVKVPAELPVEQKVKPVVADKEVRLNPAHGEPGHKCEVAVGAPLS